MFRNFVVLVFLFLGPSLSTQAISSERHSFNPCEVDLIEFSSLAENGEDTTLRSLGWLRNKGIVAKKGAAIKVSGKQAYYPDHWVGGHVYLDYAGYQWNQGIGGYLMPLPKWVYSGLPEHNCESSKNIRFFGLSKLSSSDVKASMPDLKFSRRPSVDETILVFRKPDGTRAWLILAGYWDDRTWKLESHRYLAGYDDFFVSREDDPSSGEPSYRVYDRNWVNIEITNNRDLNCAQSINRRFKVGTKSFTCIFLDCYEVIE